MSEGNTMSTANILLNVNGIEVIYNHVILVLKGVSLQVPQGKVVALLGGNGAGKTTTLRTISGMMKPRTGTLSYQGKTIAGIPAHQIMQMGISHVPEGRRIFPQLSVRENLDVGAYTVTDKATVEGRVQEGFGYFPRLKEREHQLGGTMSGGEQQMLAIARALMSRPRLLLLDEPSLGLAPIIVREIFTIIRELNGQGVTILLVEQNAKLAMNSSNRTYVLEAGQMTFHGESAQLVNDERVLHAYLGG